MKTIQINIICDKEDLSKTGVTLSNFNLNKNQKVIKESLKYFLENNDFIEINDNKSCIDKEQLTLNLNVFSNSEVDQMKLLILSIKNDLVGKIPEVDYNKLLEKMFKFSTILFEHQDIKS